MEFGFTEEQQKLRKEIHDFVQENLPEDYNKNVTIFPMGEEVQAFWQKFQDKAVL